MHLQTLLKSYAITLQNPTNIPRNELTFSDSQHTLLEAMFFHFKNPVFPFCLFANSASYTTLPNSPDFTGFYWSLADSTKIF